MRHSRLLDFVLRISDLRKVRAGRRSAKLVLAEGFPYIKLLDFQGQYTYTITRDLETADTAASMAGSSRERGADVSAHHSLEYYLNHSGMWVLDYNTTGDQQRLPDFHVINFAAIL